MGFRNRDMSVIAYANGFTYWHYRTGDTLEEVLVPGYFEKIHTLCNTGDLVIINAKDQTVTKVFMYNPATQMYELIDQGDTYVF